MPDPTPVSFEIWGEIKSNNDNLAVPFANIALMAAHESEIIGGVTSCLEGKFLIVVKEPGAYKIRISAVGYETLFLDVVVNNFRKIDLGKITLNEENINLGEVLVVAERIKAATGAETTTYFVNRNMLSASNTGTDLLKLVPGISVDIRQNISLEGSQEILILVDGVQRDRDFVTQIAANRIDKIEVSNQPSARFDGTASGVINIILTRDRNTGFEGQVYLELPSNRKEIYLFPNYSFRYGTGKLNLFTSYTGELTSYDVLESYHRNMTQANDHTTINAENRLKQQTWSHRFHYGMDYFINDRSQLNLYGYYNPFSFEYSGKSSLFLNGSESASWQVDKSDQDLNHAFFNSLFFRQIFGESEGHELTANLGLYNLRGENSTTFSNPEEEFFHQNQTRPAHQALNLRIDYRRPLPASFSNEIGGFARLEKMHDRAIEGFAHGENTFAVYNTIGYRGKRFNVLAGIRLENSEIDQSGEQQHAFTALLPGASIHFRIKTGQALRLSYRQSIRYPRLYQLNPNQMLIDPYTVHSGNPFLKPSRVENMQLEHSIRFGNQFFSTRAFFAHSRDVINQMNTLNNGILKSGNHNLGNMTQYGLQFTGAFSLGKKAGFNPVFRVFEVSTAPNAFGKEKGLAEIRNFGWHASFSAYAVLPGEVTASLVLNYSGPAPDLQITRFSDPLYFLSVEKDLGKGFRAGFISALPFAETFAYKGAEVAGTNFSDFSTGEILKSKVPFWFKVNYQFSSGRKLQSIERQREEIESIQRRGF